MNEQHCRTQIDEQWLPVAAQPAIELASNQSDEEFIAILAHDLRNYMASLHGRLELLHRRAKQEQQELDRELAASAKETLERMDRLIANVLDTVRMQRGFFELMLQPVDLVLLARQCAELLQTDSTPIMLDLPATAIVHGDEERLRQALHNLLANAIQHSPSGPPVTLSLAVETRADGPWMVLAVRDRGAGIPPELLPQIFERFAAGPRSPGLGLGLYLAHGIAVAHGGTLTVQSAAGMGTCFELALPAELRITR
jgi:two-component system, OmpR family, sensor kinase